MRPSRPILAMLLLGVCVLGGALAKLGLALAARPALGSDRSQSSQALEAVPDALHLALARVNQR
jgi:hypothetical protein